MLFNPTRDEARNFFIQTWQKRQRGQVLTPLEISAADIVALHTDYHALLEKPDAVHKEFRPEDGQINPFLHLSLHLAVAEQLSIDQPPGIWAAYQGCLQQRGDVHAALHDVLECLGEAIWTAQRQQRAIDTEAYLACLRKRAKNVKGHNGPGA